MKIFIDFDDVLFNTKDFKDDLLDVFIDNGVTKKQFFEESYWGKKYNLEKQIESVEKKYGVDGKKLKKDINYFLKNLQKYVFSDVCKFIKSIGKENLFLISYGHKKIQWQKIRGAKLDNYFERIVITKDKPRAIAEILKEKNIQNEEICFLDDRIKYIEEVKNNIPKIKTILVKRSGGRYDDQSNKYCDHEVKELSELKEIIKK